MKRRKDLTKLVARHLAIRCASGLLPSQSRFGVAAVCGRLRPSRPVPPEPSAAAQCLQTHTT